MRDQQLNQMFRAFSDSTRLRILHLLLQGELCVGDIVRILNELQPKISRHLRYLKHAGLVEMRRSGRWLFYSISPARTTFHQKLLACVQQCFGEVPQLRSDLRRAGIIQKTGGCCANEARAGSVPSGTDCRLTKTPTGLLR